MHDPAFQEGAELMFDDVDRARAQEYALLATLLSHSPDARMIGRLALLRGDASPLGATHTALAEAAANANAESVNVEYFDLFDGLGRGRLLPYASYYLTGSLYGRPLARLRETLRRLGIERAEHLSEPEDHAAILCEIMAGLAGGQIPAPVEAEREFFEKHLAPWVGRFFADLECAESADFYARVGAVGRTFVDIETEAFTLPASGRVL
jgi:TorA maturation chaperone TorD